MLPSKEKFVDEVYEHYVSSSDFNGHKIDDYAVSEYDLRNWMKELIQEELVVFRYEESGNPFIKGFPDLAVDSAIEQLDKVRLSFVVAYPSDKILKDRRSNLDFEGIPFSRRLAFGEPQLDYHCFDLSVLEFYRNDPRYYYKVGDVSGAICADSEEMNESDEIFLRTFGFAYDEKGNRSVAVFTRYLNELSPDHQRIWDAKRLSHKGKIHIDYYNSSIRGSFAKKIPILDAFILELYHVIELSKLMGYKPLFRKSYRDEKPNNFTFLIRPTAKEFNDFVLTLDQMMSDNINQKFFEDDIDLETDFERPDGKIEVRRKGTIQLLGEWVTKMFRGGDETLIREMIAAFKNVRKLRQKPAHSVINNKFDQKYSKDQRALIIEAYKAVQLIRLVLINHPNCCDYEVEDALFKGEIRDY